MSYKSIFQSIILLIREKVDPDKIILFGSRATKRAKKGSDIDIAIFGGKKLNHREERKLREKIDELAGLYSVDIVFAEKLQKTFKEMVQDQGVVIYEKGGRNFSNSKP